MLVGRCGHRMQCKREMQMQRKREGGTWVGNERRDVGLLLQGQLETLRVLRLPSPRGALSFPLSRSLSFPHVVLLALSLSSAACLRSTSGSVVVGGYLLVPIILLHNFPYKSRLFT